jgi:hypothetical protein
MADISGCTRAIEGPAIGRNIISTIIEISAVLVLMRSSPEEVLVCEYMDAAAFGSAAGISDYRKAEQEGRG